jgi:hypothetical protein
LQIVHGRPGAMDIAMPKQPLDPLDVGQQLITYSPLDLGDALGILAQYRQAHGEVSGSRASLP